DEYLAIADLARLGRAGDRVDSLVHQVAADGDFDLDLGKEGDGVLCAAINLRMPFLTAVALDLGDGQALNPHGGERFAHLVELERLDDCHHDFHQDSPFADAGPPALP